VYNILINIDVFWDMTRVIYWNRIEVSREHTISIFRVTLSSTLITEVAGSSQASVRFYQSAWHHIPQRAIFVETEMGPSNIRINY
jgi:hypothetical protein